MINDKSKKASADDRIIFASSHEAIQYLADITGNRVFVADDARTTKLNELKREIEALRGLIDDKRKYHYTDAQVNTWKKELELYKQMYRDVEKEDRDMILKHKKKSPSFNLSEKDEEILKKYNDKDQSLTLKQLQRLRARRKYEQEERSA